MHGMCGESVEVKHEAREESLQFTDFPSLRTLLHHSRQTLTFQSVLQTLGRLNEKTVEKLSHIYLLDYIKEFVAWT
jgi:hypothetical protein